MVVIFLTAYEQHVLRAFDVHALHYLLKPLDDERFATAVDRARNLMSPASNAAMAQRVLKMLEHSRKEYVSRFTVQIGSRIRIVGAEDVDWIGAAGDYVELHAGGRSYLLRETMASLEQRLDPEKFLRIHRSRIVQSRAIVELRSIDNREFILKLSDGSELRSSRTYADRLERWLSSGRN
jgi:two-component system LytT family response regulator